MEEINKHNEVMKRKYSAYIPFIDDENVFFII